jgi:hypothetical protein
MSCANNNFKSIDEFIANKQYYEACMALIGIHELTDQKKIDQYYVIIDSLVCKNIMKERQINAQRPESYGKGTIYIIQNPEFAADTSTNRRLICILWDNYLKTYPNGSLRRLFQRKMLSFGRLPYKSLQCIIAREFINSNNRELKVKGLTYLAENAFIEKNYSAAMVYFYPLLEFSNNKVDYELLMAECDYLLGDIKHAKINAMDAYNEASGREKEPVRKIVSYWLKDYCKAVKKRNSKNIQHVFIVYY